MKDTDADVPPAARLRRRLHQRARAAATTSRSTRPEAVLALGKTAATLKAPGARDARRRRMADDPRRPPRHRHVSGSRRGGGRRRHALGDRRCRRARRRGGDGGRRRESARRLQGVDSRPLRSGARVARTARPGNRRRRHAGAPRDAADAARRHRRRRRPCSSARARWRWPTSTIRSAVPPNVVNAVLRTAAAGGDRALYDRYVAELPKTRATPEEYYRFLNALGWFRDPALVTRTLEFAARRREVRSQDTSTLIGLLLTQPAAQDVAWAFVKSHWPQLTEQLGVFQGDPGHRRRARRLLLDRAGGRHPRVLREEPGAAGGARPAAVDRAHRVVRGARPAPVGAVHPLALGADVTSGGQPAWAA